jgi:molybdenum cofactor cytidylyltransferase
LKEIPVRGHPREGRAAPSHAAPRIYALILAAGRSTRMGQNKLLMEIGGVPLFHHTIGATLAAKVQGAVIVTGHEPARIAPAQLPGVRAVYNPDYASGMASSLKAGLAAMPKDSGAALIVLGDMPAVRTDDIDALISAFEPSGGKGIVVPTYNGKRGHPVLFGRAYWPSILEARGDQGARQALIDNADAVCEVPVDNPGVLMDADTPEALAALRALMDL